jgi:UDP-N-acetylglucosamine/UDP-N-acetyl-alpha-D-glucosaminouronate 4-epimerase
MKGKKIVVTGGLGFIGSHLAEALVEDNDVAIIDNKSTGKLENIRDLADKRLRVIEGDVAALSLSEIFEGCDYVFHLAALPSVQRSIKEPLTTNESNATGTLKVLIAANESGVKKVVFASSSSVYGETAELPKREDMCLAPISPYAVTKAAGELYCKVFHQVYGLPTVSLRYFNVFGPRQDPHSHYAAVIPKFIDAILKNEPPTVYGDGEQSRDFTFVKHVVDANVRACESRTTGTFNVACGRSVTLNELLALLSQIFGRDIAPEHVAPRPGDIRHSLADISRARSFGFSPRSDFKKELEETVRWFERAHRSENRE